MVTISRGPAQDFHNNGGEDFSKTVKAWSSTLGTNVI